MRDKAWKFVLAGGICVVAGLFALPSVTQSWAVVGVGAASVVCVLLGIRIHHPENRAGWLLLAGAAALFTLGDAGKVIYRHVLDRPVPVPSLCDVAYLMGYLLLFASVLCLTHDPHHKVKREDTADAAIVALGVLAMSWNFLMRSYLDEASLTTMARIVMLAYPIFDIVLVFIVFRSLVFGGSKQAYCKLLAAALLALFLANTTYDLLALHNNYGTGSPVDGLALLGYALIGVAALHPSVGQRPASPAKPVPSVYLRESPGSARIPIVAFAGFVPPAILLIGSADHLTLDVPVVSGLCLPIFALIFLRMMWLIQQITVQTDEIALHAHALEASHRKRDSLEADLRHLAFHDELTGLANRALLHDRVEHALAAMPRTGRTVALCFGDLDGFKTVNDTLGHHVGDSVLVRASRLLSSIVRPGDTVARLGGDEFAVLMVDVDRPETAVDFGHRIVSVLKNAPDFEGHQVGLSISVGIAYAEPGKSTQQLLSEADSAMYEAKQQGKNRVEVFQTSMRSRMLERLDLTSGFRWALGRSEFFLQYQPIVSLSDNRLQGFEALVRWSHPTLGVVDPLRFIPVAEETGFIVPLGRWVLVEACEQLASWSHTAELSLSVNLSRRQLISPQLADEVQTALSLSHIDPHRLILEVTESVLMDDPDRSQKALLALRDIGIRIAVDDFGTGYSSLSHLQRFPVDILKIDKSFIDPLVAPDTNGSTLVTAIIGLAQSLGLEVIAEGIEHESQLHRLVDLGCDKGQGFLMARPLDEDVASSLVARKRLTAGVS